MVCVPEAECPELVTLRVVCTQASRSAGESLGRCRSGWEFCDGKGEETHVARTGHAFAIHCMHADYENK